MLKCLFLFLFIQTEFLIECHNDGFYVVSTTERSPESNDLQKKIEALEAQIQKLQQQCQNSTIDNPQNCKKVQERGFKKSNIYHIQPKSSSESFPVVCDMKTEGGGWTYILNRFDGSQNFYLDWSNYKEGFGNLAGEFWLGLEKIHLLTGSGNNELLIELVDWNNKQVSARYNTFSVGNEREGYNLRILEGFSGDAGDSFTNEAGMRFTTKDKDQDVWSEGNCAEFSEAAWWYRDCKWSHLTGKYFKNSESGKDYLKGIYWVTFHGNTYSMKQVRMMVRPRANSLKLQPNEKFN